MEKNNHRNAIKRRITPGFAAAFIVFCGLAVLHATIVKTNLITLFGSVSPVPATAQEAFGKCVKSDGNLEVNAPIQSVKDRLEALIKENAVPYGMEDVIAGKGKNMPTADQIDKMSDSEKIALAMKMQQDMGYGGTLKVKDTEAWGQCIKLSNDFASLASDMTVPNKLGEMRRRNNKEHDKIYDETEAAIKTCPVISTGESSAPDEKCVKAKKLAGADRHIAIATRELSELKGIMAAHAAKVKPKVAQADALLARVKYGAGMDTQTRTPYNQLQGLTLQQIMILQTYSMESYTSAAKWIMDKQKIAQQQ